MEPRNLTNAQKQPWVQWCQAIFKKYQNDTSKAVYDIIPRNMDICLFFLNVNTLSGCFQQTILIETVTLAKQSTG